MKTLEQLNELSDYEINCAVAEKLGYELLPSANDKNSIIAIRYKVIFQDIDCGYSITCKDYCNVPNDYMPIAIEHGISIEFGKLVINKEDVVLCSSSVTKCLSGVFTRDKTGRAVCVAFLLMELDK